MRPDLTCPTPIKNSSLNYIGKISKKEYGAGGKNKSTFGGWNGYRQKLARSTLKKVISFW